MNKRTKALSITPGVRRVVEARDSWSGVPCCVFCGTPYNVRGEAHYVKRSQSGLGIEQNLLTVCRPCHNELDFGRTREMMLERAKAYLQSKYEDWSEEMLVYSRFEK